MKQTLFLLSFLFSTVIANGQLVNSIGVKGGISIANQEWDYKSIDSRIEKNNRTGIYSALSLEFFKSKNLSLITDIGFIEKGHKEDIEMTSADSPESGPIKTFDTKFSYFEFVPMLKIRKEIGKLIPYALLGARLDYQLSHKSEIDYSALEKDFNKKIYGLTTGAGIEYKIKKIGINSEFQYQHDFNKVLENERLEVKNRSLIVSLGIKYDFNSK